MHPYKVFKIIPELWKSAELPTNFEELGARMDKGLEATSKVITKRNIAFFGEKLYNKMKKEARKLKGL